MSQSTDRPAANALSFDLEHWYAASLVEGAVDEPVDRVERSVGVVLDLLARHDTRATFFAVGSLAEDYPALLRRIADRGHEIASHGHTHTPLFELSPAAFERELRRSSDAIRRATGEAPDGFRAPDFSLTRETAWAMSVLEADGYRYDSSVFPRRTPMYGVSGAPKRAYVPSAADPFAGDPARDGGLVEVPVSVTDDRIGLPIAGGFYARVLPTWVLRRGIDRLHRRGTPAILYFHPWEFNPDVRFDDLPRVSRFVSHHGIDGLAAKLEALLDAYEWAPIGQLVDRFERARRPQRPRIATDGRGTGR